jgi:hypothetical protein
VPPKNQKFREIFNVVNRYSKMDGDIPALSAALPAAEVKDYENSASQA